MCRHLFISVLLLTLTACLDTESDSPSTADALPGGDAAADIGVMDGEMPADPNMQPDGGPSPTMVSWCNTQFPATLAFSTGAPSDAVYSRIYVEGCTDGAETCSGVEVALGMGPVDRDPSQDPSSWTWTAATLNEAYAEDNNDEYFATLSAEAVGEFAYAFRARRDEGSWTYCDLSGSEDGFDLAETGRASVTDGNALTIGWCAIQYPAATAVASGGTTEPIYGRVFVEGCSEGERRCEGMSAQVGLGTADSLPDDSWTWVDALYNDAFIEGDNDEYSASLTPPETGDFAYAYRFRVGAEGEWVVCDTDGSDGAAVVEQLGALNVADRPIEWCNIQFPEALEGAAGAESDSVYGRVYSPECTDGAGLCHGLRMQVGSGPADVSPEEMLDAFTWVDGTPNPAHVEDDNDEFQATLTLNADHTRFAVRFSGDGGASWTLCDRDGPPFEAAQMGTITISP